MPKISQIDEVPCQCQAEVRILQKITLKYLLIQKSDTAQYTLKTEVPVEVPQVTALTS